jgi:hypothetical protein
MHRQAGTHHLWQRQTFSQGAVLQPRRITKQPIGADLPTPIQAGHAIAISFRQSACGGYVATLLHFCGGGIDSGLCPSLLEARRLVVLGHGREEGP